MDNNKCKLFYATDAMIWHYEGRYYAAGLANIILRYTKYFGAFTILCRIYKEKPKSRLTDITDCISESIGVESLLEFMLMKNALKKRIQESIEKSDVVAIRTPAICAAFVSTYAHKIDKPVMIEMMGCPWDANWNHSLKGKLIAPLLWFQTKRIAAKATYSHYVTELFLQRRYPSHCLQLAASDVVISPIDEIIISRRIKKIQCMDKKKIRLMTSAACDVKYKGQQYVIEALSILRKNGIEARYSICGNGETSFLQSIALKHGVSDLVDFKGRLPLNEVFEELDSTDIYIQPSLQEGLPRALVEAMSRGCPAIGAHTGGIPELLPSECVVKRKSAKAIAETIIFMLNNNLQKYSDMSFKRASDFEKEKLDSKFKLFYSILKNEIK